MIIEPLVQAAAGMLTAPPGYLRGVRELCDRYDVLLICDEVAAGVGRTGTFFACEQEDVTPDILVVGKGLSGGYLPIAATHHDATRSSMRSSLRTTSSRRSSTDTPTPATRSRARRPLANLDLMDERDTVAGVRERRRCSRNCWSRCASIRTSSRCASAG